ncbi:MAG: hypothetical protein DSY82_04835, partial [Flavobacteriia bacterium]
GVNDYSAGYSAQSLKYFKLYQNYPNPVAGHSTIKYTILQPGNVKLSIYDYTGREIKTLVNEYKNEGDYEVQFNFNNVTSGLYFCKLTMGDLSQSVKILIKNKA